MAVEILKLYAIKPTKTTDLNLCTNPSFETVTTGYATGGTNTIAVSTAQARRGVSSCLCTYQDNDALLTYAATLTAATYTISVDIYIPTNYDGADLVLSAYNFTSATITVGRPSMAIRDKWQRIHAHILPDAGDLSGSFYVYENGANATAGRFIYVDGVQIELRSEPSTYFDGYSVDCYWNGTANASTSTRKATTRRGGTLVNIEDYLSISTIAGLGMGPFYSAKTPTLSGRSMFQKTLKSDREIVLSGEILGANYDELQTARQGLIDLFKPDYVTGDQDVTLRYIAETAAGVQASEPVDFRVRLRPDGLLGNWTTPTFERVSLIFECYDDPTRDGDNANALGYQTATTAVNAVIQRSIDGTWSKMGTGILNSTPIIWMEGMKVHPTTGEVWAFGEFTSAGGVANTEFLARWNGSVWNYVISAMTGTVYDVEFDAAANAYIGGSFLNAGAVAAADYIYHWDGSTVTALGTGMNGAVYALAMSPDGSLYAGGNFTLAGGVADTVYIAKWNTSAWVPLSTGLNNYVNAIAIKSATEIYIAGAFTNVAGGTTDYIVMWNGTAFSALGTGMNGEVYALCLDNNGKLLAGGDFTSAGGVAGTSKIARWTGLQWEPAGNLTTGFDNDVLTLFKGIDGTIYAGGRFTKADDITFVNPMAMMKNNMWSSLDVDLPGGEIEGFAEKEDGTFYVCFHGTENITATSATVTTSTATGTSTYPKIVITGPGTIWQIKNYTNGKAVYFDGLTLLAGEVITLDFEKQTYVSTFRGNILNYIIEGTSTLDFSLEPGSNNVSAYLFGSTTAASKITMTYKVRYWSVDEAQL